MAYKTQSQKMDQISEEIGKHRKDIDEQKSITKFFTIIVAATLVATLVGLGGLYISAFNNTDSFKEDIITQIGEIKLLLESNQKDIYENKSELNLIKVRNPYLK